MSLIVSPHQMIGIDNQHIGDVIIRDCLIPTDSLHFGHEFMNHITHPNIEFDEGEVRYIKERCKQFALELIIQCQQRLPDNIQTLLTLSNFSPENSTKTNKNNLSKLPVHFEHTFPDKDAIENEWSRVSFLDFEDGEKKKHCEILGPNQATERRKWAPKFR